jgi:hypothetical protein
LLTPAAEHHYSLVAAERGHDIERHAAEFDRITHAIEADTGRKRRSKNGSLCDRRCAQQCKQKKREQTETEQTQDGRNFSAIQIHTDFIVYAKRLVNWLLGLHAEECTPDVGSFSRSEATSSSRDGSHSRRSEGYQWALRANIVIDKNGIIRHIEGGDSAVNPNNAVSVCVDMHKKDASQ